MKQVNFKKLSVEIEIDQYQTLDFRKEVGNAIHRQAVTIPVDELARKIYHSDGPIEIDDEDYEMMKAIISKSFALIILQAIERSTIELKDKEE